VLLSSEHSCSALQVQMTCTAVNPYICLIAFLDNYKLLIHSHLFCVTSCSGIYVCYVVGGLCWVLDTLGLFAFALPQTMVCSPAIGHTSCCAASSAQSHTDIHDMTFGVPHTMALCEQECSDAVPPCTGDCWCRTAVCTRVTCGNGTNAQLQICVAATPWRTSQCQCKHAAPLRAARRDAASQSAAHAACSAEVLLVL
jgi:hypothetical protein